MGKRLACSKATRGVSKGKKPESSSSSNPRCTKFRSQYNNLAVIAKGGPSKKSHNKESLQKIARSALERQKILDGLESINMLGKDGNTEDRISAGSDATRLTTASFASVWSNCSISSLKEFFDVWNPKLEPHKDALSVIAGLTEIMKSKGTEQTDLEFTKRLFKILENPDTTPNIIAGSLIALTFVLRKLPAEVINQNFDLFYRILANLMEKHENSKKKSLLKGLIRCFSILTRAHPRGKEILDKGLRKKINISIRKCKVQNKVRL